MQRCLARAGLLGRSMRFAAGNSRGLGTAAHPNPGNFANRPKEELHEIAKKGGQRGGKAKGVGGFHNMDPEKQVRGPHAELLSGDCDADHSALAST